MTSIADLLDEEIIIAQTPYSVFVEEGKEADFILDLSNSIESRMNILEKYFRENEKGAIEILRQLNSMWFMCGIKAIENFFIALCDSQNVASLLKLSVAKSLGDGTNDKEPAKKALISILNIGELPTPCRIEAIELLLKFNGDSSMIYEYFKEFLFDTQIEDGFKYKTILNLENLASQWIREQLYDLFPNKEFVKYIFTISATLIKQEFPKFKPELDNEDFFELMILRMGYDKLTETWKIYCTNTINKYEYLISQLQLQFVNMGGNSIFYRILSAQYLLQKFYTILSPEDIENIENILLEFAENPLNTENQRADAADTLMHLGCQTMKDKGKNIILSLGYGDREINTLYTNSQNVHNEELESSILELLEFFAEYTTLLINRLPITFQQVRRQIENLSTAKYDKEKIQLSLNRIQVDRVLFSKYNMSLETLLIKLWSYIQNNPEYKEQLLQRLLEELQDMSGTCSSGFASRIVNVVSGFGDFSLRISWEDQIVSNFNGRLNAMVRNITLEESIYRNEHYDTVTSLQKDNEDLNMEVESVLESFSQCVLEELPLRSSEPYKRKNFNFFLKHSFPIIRQEMYEEFSPFLDDTTFDLYFRKALMHYEGEC
jgi:hypothetical protein